MSNAMRSGKRALAGVAAGALALGMLTIASAPAASAKPSIKPKAGTVTATAGAVRSSGSGATAISLPAASLLWQNAGSISAASRVTLVDAPSASARLYWGSSDDSSTLLADDTIHTGALANVSDDSVFQFRVDTAGFYSGRIANGTDTVTFSFTTAGAPASIALTPASQSVPVGGTAEFRVAVLDSSGRTTQIQNADSILLSQSGAGGTLPSNPITASDISVGFEDFEVTALNSGATTLTATPQGTISPATGVAAQSASITASGTIRGTAIANLTVTTPSTAVNSGTFPTKAAQVPSGTTSMTVTVNDDTTGSVAGGTVRLAVWSPQGVGTINGEASDDTQYVNVTTGSDKTATASLTLGGGAQAAGNQVWITQVNSANSVVGTGAGTPLVQLRVTQTTPAVQVNSIIPSPSGQTTATVGASTSVSVLVDDSFGNPQANWTVAAQRTNVNGSAVTAATLSSAVTGADGLAAVTVSPLSTTTNGQYEVYTFVATSNATGTQVTATLTLQVNYTTSGGVSSLSTQAVASDGTTGVATAVTSTSPTVANMAAIRVATGDDTQTGLVAPTGAAGSTSTAVYTVATAATTGTQLSLARFAVSSTPQSAFTVSGPEGIKVSCGATAPSSTTLYSAGSNPATCSAGAAVYVWATKTGIHDVTFTAGGLSVVNKVRVTNNAKDTYNVEITPATTELAAGAIGTTTVRITDMFGNLVPTGTTAVADNAIEGPALFGGFTNAQEVATGTTGTYSQVLIAGSVSGDAVMTSTIKLAATAAAAPTYTPPAGIAAPKLTSVATVKVGAAPATKSITIVGERTTVSGKPGIRINGVTTGIENGKTVIPYFRFPGQTEYTQGAARPVVNDDEFTWQRKTGKKFYAYVTNDDGLVKSNRVIIAAR